MTLDEQGAARLTVSDLPAVRGSLDTHRRARILRTRAVSCSPPQAAVRLVPSEVVVGITAGRLGLQHETS